MSTPSCPQIRGTSWGTIAIFCALFASSGGSSSPPCAPGERRSSWEQSGGRSTKRGARKECSAFSSLQAHYTRLLVLWMFTQGMGMRCPPNDSPEQDEVCWKWTWLLFIGLRLVHENHHLLSLEMLEMTLWECMSTKGMRSVQGGHSSEGKQEEALLGLETSTQLQEWIRPGIILWFTPCIAVQGQAWGQGSKERMRKRGSYDYLRWSWGWGRVPGCSRGQEETGCLQQPPRAGTALRPSAVEPFLQCAQHLVVEPAYDQHRKELFPDQACA